MELRYIKKKKNMSELKGELQYTAEQQQPSDINAGLISLPLYKQSSFTVGLHL